MVSHGQLSFLLNPTYNHSVLVSISSCPLGDSGIRGIPEGDFPCFILSVWPLKTCLVPKTKVQVILANMSQCINTSVQTAQQHSSVYGILASVDFQFLKAYSLSMRHLA